MANLTHIAVWLQSAARALLSVCDGAVSDDGQGYSQYDGSFGRELAGSSPAGWSDGRTRAAYQMLRKYRGQLEGLGHPWESCPPMPAVESQRSLTYHVGLREFRASWAYQDADMDVLKALVKKSGRARWEPAAKVWTLTDRVVALDLVEEWGFVADSRAQAALDGTLPTLPEPTPAPAPAAPRNPYAQSDYRASREGDQLVLESPYDPALVAAVKALDSRRFDPARKIWLVTLDSRNVDAVRSVLREYDFSATDEVVAWVRSAGAREEATVALSQAMDSDTQLDTAGLGGRLRAFQVPAVELMIQHKRVLVGDEMGLGKTIEALAAIHVAKAYPAIIVCPASVKGNWEREARRWLPGALVAVLNGSRWTRQGVRVKTAQEALQGADVVIVNYDVVGRYVESLRALQPRAVVLDESHYAKNAKAARSKAVAELAKGIEFIWLLTGTPIINRPIELTHQLGILGRLDLFRDPSARDPKHRRGWWAFARLHCAARQIEVGRGKVAWDMSGASRLDEMVHTLRAAGAYVGRKKTDALPGLPPKQHTTVRITPAKVRAYVSAIQAAEALLVEAGHHGSAALEAITAMRVAAMRAKLDGIREWVEGFRLASDNAKLVVFAHHREAQAMLMSAFADLNPAHVFGDDSAEERTAQVARFQSDPCCTLMVASLKAAGVGITLTAASHAAFCELPWTHADLAQAEDRIHRIGQDEGLDAVNYYHLLITSVDGCQNIDNYMREIISAKRAVTERATAKSPIQALAEAMLRRELDNTDDDDDEVTAEGLASRDYEDRAYGD